MRREKGKESWSESSLASVDPGTLGLGTRPRVWVMLCSLCILCLGHSLCVLTIDQFCLGGVATLQTKLSIPLSMFLERFPFTGIISPSLAFTLHFQVSSFFILFRTLSRPFLRNSWIPVRYEEKCRTVSTVLFQENEPPLRKTSGRDT